MKLEKILKACICAFGQTTFDLLSLEDDEFTRALEYYITDDKNFEEMLEEYAYEFDYDIDNILNISNNPIYKDKQWNYIDIMNNCRLANEKTITEDKKLNVEAFINNIVNKLK